MDSLLRSFRTVLVLVPVSVGPAYLHRLGGSLLISELWTVILVFRTAVRMYKSLAKDPVDNTHASGTRTLFMITPLSPSNLHYSHDSYASETAHSSQFPSGAWHRIGRRRDSSQGSDSIDTGPSIDEASSSTFIGAASSSLWNNPASTPLVDVVIAPPPSHSKLSPIEVLWIVAAVLAGVVASVTLVFMCCTKRGKRRSARSPRIRKPLAFEDAHGMKAEGSWAGHGTVIASPPRSYRGVF